MKCETCEDLFSIVGEGKELFPRGVGTLPVDGSQMWSAKIPWELRCHGFLYTASQQGHCYMYAVSKKNNFLGDDNFYTWRLSC